MDKHISLIVAMTPHRVIGKNNALPWHLPADLKHFKQLTMGKAIVMGRKTFEAIGRPLPGRLNIILTHQQAYQPAGCLIAHSLENVITASGSLDLMIIGGADIYRLFLPKAHEMYLTTIHAEIPGDTYFPSWNHDDWEEISREDHQANLQNAYDYSFVRLKRSGGMLEN